MSIARMQAAPHFPGPLTRGFLLVEPTTLVHVPELAAVDMRPCTPRVLSHREELMPQLIDLAALDDEARGLATECWIAETHAERPPVVCAWLDSEGCADAISGHIARYLVGPGANGEVVFWRFHDPRVLALTLAVFDPAQRRALFGPIRAWQFAWAGHRWNVTNADAGATDDDQSGGWPRPEQWARISRSETADRVLRRLPAMSVEQAARLPADLDRMFSEAVLSSDMNGPDVLVESALRQIRNESAYDAEI